MYNNKLKFILFSGMDFGSSIISFVLVDCLLKKNVRSVGRSLKLVGSGAETIGYEFEFNDTLTLFLPIFNKTANNKFTACFDVIRTNFH